MSSVVLFVLIGVVAVLAVAVVVGLVAVSSRRRTPPAAPPAPPTSTAPAPETTETPAPAPAAAPALERPEGTASRLVRLRQRLSGSQGALGRGLLALLSRDRLDEDTWEDIEDTLITADIGVGPATELVERLRTRLRVEGGDAGDARAVLREELLTLVDPTMDRSLRVDARDGEHSDGPSVVLVVGVNGAGKTSILSLLDGSLAPQAGRVRQGRTVALAHLTQQLDDIDPEARVLDTVESIRRVTRTLEGRELSATSLLERFGFTGDRLTARLGDLSGGERRRFQLLRLLLTEPNVLFLDEPTNDLDIETLTVLEDFLDGWPGTLIVVSHDRYFLERVTDSVWALLGDGQISMLPRGVDEYLERRLPSSGPNGVPDAAVTPEAAQGAQATLGEQSVPAAKAKSGSAEERNARKTVARIDKRLARIAEQEAELNIALAEHVSDYEKLAELGRQLDELLAEKADLEVEWLEAAEVLE